MIFGIVFTRAFYARSDPRGTSSNHPRGTSSKLPAAPTNSPLVVEIKSNTAGLERYDRPLQVHVVAVFATWAAGNCSSQ